MKTVVVVPKLRNAQWSGGGPLLHPVIFCILIRCDYEYIAMIKKILDEYFEGINEVTKHNLSFLVEGIMRSGTASPWHAARAMSASNDKSFKTNEKRVNRLLQDANFQLDDKMFRKYINLLFAIFEERNLLKEGDNLQINVDYTTDRDDFIILMASINFNGRAVPLYFSMRAYPKRKGQHDQKRLEASFIRALRHLLSKKYTYIIVADRGFGNDRLAQMCAESGFDYTLRINENLKIKVEDKACNLSSFKGKSTKFTTYVFTWERHVNFEIRTKDESTWFLMVSKPEIPGVKIYERRFSIEKCFQDQKSSGLNIEKCKIKKYDRFQRLYFAACVAQLFIVMVGEYVESEKHPLKKNFPILANAISVFSNSDGMLAKSCFIKQSILFAQSAKI